MSTFRYRARDKSGGISAGKVEAPSAALAEQTLLERGVEIVLLQEVRERFNIPFRARVRARDLVIFSRQLAVLSGANVALVKALKTLVVQTANSELRRVLAEVSDDVEAGGRLSVALGKHSRIFGAFFVNMIKSGETAGRLSDVLNYLAEQTEKEYDLTSKIRGAMMYPAFIVIGMVIISIILMVFVIPQLTAVLLESGVELPITTRLLIGTSKFMRSFWWLLLGGAVGLLVAFRLGLRTARFRELVDRLKLRIPVLGSLLQKIYLARISRSLQILLSGGVDTVGALEVVGGVVGNAYYARLIRDTKREVADGNPISTVFIQSSLIPPMVPQMLAVGEESGQLTAILERLTDFYTREVDNGVTTLISVIEPLLMVVIGVGVGIVVASIILPMYKLAGQF